jgi:hypothetical protein
MSGRSAIAFSSRFLPMKHQGQTTSETTSTVSGWVIDHSLVSRKLCFGSRHRNRTPMNNVDRNREIVIQLLKE